ncbi:phenylalanine--tRNA ligase, mitochondrial [Trichomonascus vanleenenianus]|uniref:phenylalanine--tRNA ligase n=1 Tax=Trichomonascus vanleenenianus TaxID=2268995 RepID=UPI003ECA6C5E
MSLLRACVPRLSPIGRISTVRWSSTKKLTVLGKKYATDDWTNVPESILKLTGRNLHLNPTHPIGILRSVIEKRLSTMGYTCFNDFRPVVTTEQNFDVLGFPQDHPGRSKTDTYYINKDTLLRTHTSAHEPECFRASKTPGYLISADVYRRDTIDRTHYPAFHQMEGARVWERSPELAETLKKELAAMPDSGIVVEDPNPPFGPSNPKQETMTDLETELVSQHLKRTVEIVMGELLGKARESAIKAGSTDPDLMQPIKARWIEAYFPWTAPSYEIEIWWKGEWLEMCGCGVVQESVLKNNTEGDKIGWAFGIGLERSAMLLFNIPDIRLFWSQDKRFLDQFSPDTVSTFKPFSKYPGTVRDVAFWLPDRGQDIVHENDLMEIIRGIAGDMVENVSLIDEFVHPKTGRKSQCYRINYQSMDRNITNDEVNELQQQVLDELSKRFPIEIRN